MPHKRSPDINDSCDIVNSSFSDRASRYVPLAGLLVVVLLIFVHAVVYFSKENGLRAHNVYSYLEELVNSIASADQFWRAILYGIGILVATFMMVLYNSRIPGIEPPLPWDSTDGPVITVSYAMCPLMGLLTFVYCLKPDLFTWTS
ncbi:uncharacterized protein LOC142557255 [Dermacentor variabilis]|uniref:uncharacterized protein LOC142557255 n=1 Tax=Dermacentor variabilis TaxID=34621 RepID=UPI003F5CB605